jgi:hypothetical protein
MDQKNHNGRDFRFGIGFLNPELLDNLGLTLDQLGSQDDGINALK